MATDIYSEGDRYFLEVDVPGVEQEAIDVTVEKKTLTVTVERRGEDDTKRVAVIRDRPFGTFTRRFFLSDGLEPEAIEATLENGVLTLSIPIVETAKAKKIEVGVVRKAVTG
jgi:HSP20 family protein